MITRRTLTAASFASLGLGRGAMAQAFPSRPIRLIVPYPAGGGVDVTARILAEPVGRRLGQTVVVENRSGAAGAIGVEACANAAPDGYTLVMTAPGPITVGPNLRPHPYDPLALTHVIRLARSPLVLVARKTLPAADLAALARMVKEQPEAVRFASGGAGTGTHMAGELFALRAGGRMIHVPYRGTAPAITDLIAGNVDIFFSDSSVYPFVQRGELRGLGVSTAEAWPGMPGLPPIGSVIEGFDLSNWYGVAAPPGTPAAVTTVLHDAFAQALAEPDVATRLLGTGFSVAPMAGAPFAAFIRAESETWAGVIRAANIRLD